MWCGFFCLLAYIGGDRGCRAVISYQLSEKKSLSFVFFNIFIILVFISLGTWQLHRKAEKETLIETIITNQQKPAQNADDIQTPESYTPLFATGHFVPGKTITLQSKVHQGKSGIYILDVFQTLKGKFLLVQRGWASQEMRDVPLEILRIEGIARMP